jgi:hypothetical protein
MCRRAEKMKEFVKEGSYKKKIDAWKYDNIRGEVEGEAAERGGKL